MSNTSQVAEILISSHLMLFHSVKQSLIMSSTGWRKRYVSLLSHYVNITFVTANMYQVCLYLSCRNVI